MKTISYPTEDGGKVNFEHDEGAWEDTHFQGEMKISYAELRDVFGYPDYFDNSTYPQTDEKVNCEWTLRIDNVPVTIYSWKEYRLPKDVDSWHIGGNSEKAVHKVKETINAYKYYRKNY